MTTIRKARSYFVYLLALFVAGLFSMMGRSTPGWAEDTQMNYNARIFNERFRVAQSTNTTSQHTNPTMVYNSKAVFPDGARDVFPDGARDVFPDGARAVFPDNPSLENLVYNRGVFPDYTFSSGIEVENRDFSDAIDAINIKIRDKVELNAIERGFIRSLEMNRNLIDQNRLLMQGR